MLFSSFPYDYPLLWTSDDTPALFYDQLETHLRFLHASPPIIPRILHIAIFIGFSGFLIKLFKPSESNLLFDGASLVLYTVGVIVYITNIVKGLRIVTAGTYDQSMIEGERHVPNASGDTVIGREDSLKVLAASNTILALVLVGVIVLQAGQWYAESKDRAEDIKFQEEKDEKTKLAVKVGSHNTRSVSKKKQ